MVEFHSLGTSSRFFSKPPKNKRQIPVIIIQQMETDFNHLLVTAGGQEGGDQANKETGRQVVWKTGDRGKGGIED
jgi:hypothetical protein